MWDAVGQKGLGQAPTGRNPIYRLLRMLVSFGIKFAHAISYPADI